VLETSGTQIGVAETPVGFAVNGKTLYAPTPKQVVFHNCPAKNALYGGAAGGGKSHALRWDAYIRCVSLPFYRALLLRRTNPELENTHLEAVPVDLASGLPGEYLKSEKKLRFPNGAVLAFGHCEDDAAVSKHLSTEYDAVYFDELVTFTEKQFLMIRSRARSTKPGVSPVVRAGTNPGGAQSHWVRRRFIWQDIGPVEDPRYRPEDYAYIPATLDDNPHLDQAEYAALLESLPGELARAYRFGDWDIFPGQYFPEWRKVAEVDGKTVPWHVSAEHLEYPREWPRSLAMDWGYVKPGWVGWFVHRPEGHAYLEQEYVPVRVNSFDQGYEVGRRCKERGLKKLLFLVYDHQMQTPQTETGEPIIETFQRGLRKAGVSIAVRKADKDRKNGWARLRGWYKADPTGREPWMQVSPECRYTCRTIPSLVSDESDPEDVDTDGEDHAGDALRYWAMSRPSPVAQPASKALPPMSLGWLKQQSETVSGLLSRRTG
jgi:phage terminase large subunit